MVEASKVAAMYGLYSKHGCRTIDTHDYIDEGKFRGLERMYMATMIRDAQDG